MDEDWHVRYFVARNPKTPKEILMKLSKDEALVVQDAAMANPSFPK